VLWDTYYKPPAEVSVPFSPQTSEFRTVFGTRDGRDRFYRFQTVFHLFQKTACTGC
jgi:hypothetical protein